MISPGPEGFKLETMFLPATASPADPLAQRPYLAIKMRGGLIIDQGREGLSELCDHIAEQVQAALVEALNRPEETVVVERVA